jgi:iron complex transport system permease protein
MRRALLVWACLAAAAAVAALLAVAVGSVAIGPRQWWAIVTGGAVDGPQDLILQLRAARAAVAFACGALLGLSGALLQALLRNPLADPYVMGISSGAAAGALLAMAGGWAWGAEAAAALGAFVAVVLLFALSGRVIAARPSFDGQAPARLILTGVMLASSFAAVSSLILTLAPESELRGMLFWLMGDLSGSASLRWPWWPWCGLVVSLAAAMALSPDLNLLARSEVTAHALGVPVAVRRWQVMLLASFATAVAVTAAGAVGFVGLVVPHILRLVVGNDQRVLVPAAALGGGIFLLAADTAARSIAAPVELPVGVVTALAGAPLFIGLLMRGHHGGRHGR